MPLQTRSNQHQNDCLPSLGSMESDSRSEAAAATAKDFALCEDEHSTSSERRKENSNPSQEGTPDPHTECEALDLRGVTRKKRGRAEGANNCDHDTVLVLLRVMKEIGYGDRKRQQKSLKQVFQAAVKLAEEKYIVKRTAKAWQKKFNRIKQEYSAFIAKISESGRDGDDEDLYDTPPFFKEMHELERNRARHNRPGHISAGSSTNASDDSNNSSVEPTSSRKRMKMESKITLETLDKNAAARHKLLLEEMRKGNEEKSRLRAAIEKLVDKF